MASIIGSVSPFNETEDTWQAYAERLEHFFLANEIDSEAKKRAVLLSSMGVEPYKLLSNLVAPRKAGECSYTEIVDVLKNHHNPRPSTIVQRFKFNIRVRGASESIRPFVAELKKLSEFCEYNDSLEEMLRDRLVCGINNRRIQQRLLSERSLTFAKALDIAHAMEAAAEGIEDLSDHITDKTMLPPMVNDRAEQESSPSPSPPDTQSRKIQHDKHAVDRDISVGDDVFVRNFSLHGGKWLPGGETMSNRYKIMQGQLDTQLSELGEEQARLVGMRLKDQCFRHVFSSDLTRAANTAKKILAENRSTACGLTLDHRLRERGFGSLEGRPFTDFKKVQETSGVPHEMFTPQGGETIEQF
ncbi:hypothetical protein RRG08_046579 [Elysia crispata]|uniref:Tick transposon n=1 Tax=Elysia crispata TaxID=231223 RepID=A0AAE1ARJ8_9GAST|nr:hypothetical protein RRG08_046579 [Elysia crispata]